MSCVQLVVILEGHPWIGETRRGGPEVGYLVLNPGDDLGDIRGATSHLRILRGRLTATTLDVL